MKAQEVLKKVFIFFQGFTCKSGSQSHFLTQFTYCSKYQQALQLMTSWGIVAQKILGKVCHWWRTSNAAFLRRTARAVPGETTLSAACKSVFCESVMPTGSGVLSEDSGRRDRFSDHSTVPGKTASHSISLKK